MSRAQFFVSWRRRGRIYWRWRRYIAWSGVVFAASPPIFIVASVVAVFTSIQGMGATSFTGVAWWNWVLGAVVGILAVGLFAVADGWIPDSCMKAYNDGPASAETIERIATRLRRVRSVNARFHGNLWEIAKRAESSMPLCAGDARRLLAAIDDWRASVDRVIARSDFEIKARAEQAAAATALKDAIGWT